MSPTDAEVTASERESYEATIDAQTAEIARLKDDVEYWSGLYVLWVKRGCAYRARLARLCRAMSTDWVPWRGVYGQAWSRRVPQTPTRRTP